MPCKNSPQKRLLLSNLKETHEEWKITTHLKCGFSTFAGLRPPHCVRGGGTHRVCVCMEHQNFKLMLHAAGIKETCEELVATTVRQLDNEKCMIGKCEKYPGTDHAEAHLRNAPAFQSDEADGLQVTQWVKGTRCRLEALILMVGSLKRVRSGTIGEKVASYLSGDLQRY